MKKIISLILVAASLMLLCGCNVEKYSDYVQIEMENGGIIKLQLYPDIAPETVKNFQKLVADGFYDGLIFHRVIEGFMIQGGDPNGDGTGGSNKTIKGEFAANGIQNSLSHERGVISMGRTSTSYDSASSQFFICHEDSLYLDGQYAAFGRVLEGMDVVDAIATVDTDMNDKPLLQQKIKTISFIEFEDITPDTTAPTDTTTAYTVTDRVEIEMENGGIIKLELYGELAPITVTNFVDLANSGFYDGLIFHRVIEGFMIQGGDPTGTGMGGSAETIKGEFAANGVQNDLSHSRGVISMARKSYPNDSASSQFFICHADAFSLDGQYAAFGRVTEGMDVVDAIATVETDASDKPVQEQKIKTIRVLEEKSNG